MVANSGILSSLSATPTSQLTDKIDSPHSGLFKGLHSMAQGNYALKDGATLGFAHTFTTSSGTIRVELTAGKGFSNGRFITVDAGLGPLDLPKPSSGAFYHWIAFADDGDGTGTVTKIEGTSDGVVPDLTVTLTPISLIKVQSTDTHSTVAFQTFTTSKTKNRLSIGYENSNTYTEAGSILGTSNGLIINGITSATVASDDKVLIQDTNAGDVIKSVTVSSIAALAGGASLANDGNNRIVTATGAGGINGEAALTFDGSLLSLTSLATTTDVFDITADGVTTAKVIDITADALTTGSALNIISDSSSTSTRDIVYIKNDNTAATETTALKVESDSTGRVLHVKGHGNGASLDSDPIVLIESTDSDTATAPDIVLYRNSSSAADDDHLGHLLFRGKNDHSSPQNVTYAQIYAKIDDVRDTQEDGKLFLRTILAGSLANRIEMNKDEVVINNGGNNLDFRVEGNNNTHTLFVNGDTDAVGIKSSSPANTLEIGITGNDGQDGIQIVRVDSTTAAGDLLGGIGFDSSDGNIPSSIEEASAFIAAYATEAHSASAKGGELKMGITIAGTADDTTSTTLSRIGYPTSTNATVYAGAFSRAAVASVGGATYAPQTSDSGIVIFMTDPSSIITLPAIGSINVGVQFTIINNSGGNITGQIRSVDTVNARFNGAGTYANQDIDDNKAKTFICYAANQWQVIG